MLKIRQGPRVEYGFLFATGSLIRVLDEYEHGRKGKVTAVLFFARAIVDAFNKNAHLIESSLEPMRAEILLDGVPLPYDEFVLTACSITGSLQIGMQPFTGERGGETFFSLAYAVSAREVSVPPPSCARGMLPIDPKSLLQPVSQVTHIGLSYFSKGSLPLPMDPRYVNHPVKEYEIRSAEKVYTIDGRSSSRPGSRSRSRPVPRCGWRSRPEPPDVRGGRAARACPPRAKDRGGGRGPSTAASRRRWAF